MDLVISTLSIFTRYFFSHSTGDTTPLQPCLHPGAEHLDVSEDASPLRLPYRVDSTLDPLPLWQPGESLGHCIVTTDFPSAPAGFRVLRFHNVMQVIICVPATLVRIQNIPVLRLPAQDSHKSCPHDQFDCCSGLRRPASHLPGRQVKHCRLEQPTIIGPDTGNTSGTRAASLAPAAPFDNARTLPEIHAKVPCGHCPDVAPTETHFRSTFRRNVFRILYPVWNRPACSP